MSWVDTGQQWFVLIHLFYLGLDFKIEFISRTQTTVTIFVRCSRVCNTNRRIKKYEMLVDNMNVFKNLLVEAFKIHLYNFVSILIFLIFYALKNEKYHVNPSLIR